MMHCLSSYNASGAEQCCAAFDGASTFSAQPASATGHSDGQAALSSDVLRK